MKINKLIATAIIGFSSMTVFSQNGTMTPYSRYGYGIIGDHATSTQRAMGGVGYAMNNGRQINAMNPASYAAIDTLTFLFDVGLDLTAIHQSEIQNDEKVSDNKFGGGLDYVTMQVPLGKRMGASLGLLPYSSVGYSFGNKIDNGIDSRQGSGSLNEFYLGVSGKIFNGFTLGAQISYLFGTILNDSYATITSSQYSLFQNQMSVRDFHLLFGAQYSINLPKDNRLTFGLTYSPEKTLLGTARTVKVYASGNTSQSEVVDSHKLKGNYSLPETWGAGINYQLGRKIMLEFDYTYQPWSKAKYRGFESTPITFSFADRSKYALGFQYVPNWRGSYFKRINYRLGAYYTNDYLQILSTNGDPNRLKEHGITAGFGFPVPSFKTTVNLGFEWKSRRAHPNPLIKENYFSVTIGVNFNEMWFRQSKIY